MIALDATAPREAWEHITRREREVLTLIAAGHNTADIAAELGVTPATIRAHVEHMRDRLDVPTRAALVARAIRVGFLN